MWRQELTHPVPGPPRITPQQQGQARQHMPHPTTQARNVLIHRISLGRTRAGRRPQPANRHPEPQRNQEHRQAHAGFLIVAVRQTNQASQRQAGIGRHIPQHRDLGKHREPLGVHLLLGNRNRIQDGIRGNPTAFQNRPQGARTQLLLFVVPDVHQGLGVVDHPAHGAITHRAHLLTRRGQVRGKGHTATMQLGYLTPEPVVEHRELVIAGPLAPLAIQISNPHRRALDRTQRIPITDNLQKSAIVTDPPIL